MKETSEDIEKQIVYLKEAIKAEKMMQKKFVLIPRQLNNSKRKIKTYQNDIKTYTMKLKKGSKAARDFMAKLRASRGKKTAPKKTKIAGTKKKIVKPAKAKKIHTDVKNHNYKISISGAENAIKQKAKELYDNNMNLYGHWCAALLVAKTKTDKNIIKKRLSEIKSNINHYKKFIK
jgi:hypothetical protein